MLGTSEFFLITGDASLSNEPILMPNINKFYNLLMHKENQTFQVNCLKYNTGTLFS